MRTLPPVLPAGDSTAMSFNLEQSSLISLRGYSERFPFASGLLFRPAGHRRDARGAQRDSLDLLRGREPRRRVCRPMGCRDQGRDGWAASSRCERITRHRGSGRHCTGYREGELGELGRHGAVAGEGAVARRRRISEYMDKRSPLNRYRSGAEPHRVAGDQEMRILRLTLVGMLALSTPIVAHAGQAGSNTGLAGAGPAPRFVQVWDGNGSGRHPVPGGWAGGGHPNAGHSSQRGGDWARPHWGPNGYYGFVGSA